LVVKNTNLHIISSGDTAAITIALLDSGFFKVFRSGEYIKEYRLTGSTGFAVILGY
jgi:hypothetical protein